MSKQHCIENHKELCLAIAAVAVAAFTLGLFAGPLTLTWDGGASGSFSTGPWSGGAEGHATPQSGDTLVFGTGGTFENNITGLSVAGLSFTSATAVTLTGSQIAVANGGTLATTGAGEVTFNVPLSLGTAATPDVTINVASDCTNTFNACVSGAANILYTNQGAVNLRADNDYTGTTTIKLGQIHVYANNAFGSTVGNTTYAPASKTSNAHVFLHGVTTDENFDVPSKVRAGAFTFPDGTTNVFNGTFRERDGSDFTYGANTKVSYNGVTYFINPGCKIPASSVIELNGEGSGFAKWGDYWDGTGSIYYNAKCYYENVIRIGSATKRYFNCENAALYKPESPAGISLVANNSLLDMCGYDQTFSFINCASSYSGCVITSDAPSTVHLTLGGSDAKTCYAKFKGAISLSFEGAQPMSFGTASTSTGFLSLTNEASITLLSGFAWSGTSLTVSDGSALTVNSVTLPANLSVAISDREASGGMATKFSRIVLNADVPCALLKMNGVAMEGGKTYGSTASGADVQDDDHFAGNGLLRMSMPEPLTLTWNGGAAGNFSMDSWSGGEEGHMKPMRGDTLVFPIGGTFENDIAGLIVSGLKFTSSDPVALTGSQILVQNGGSGLVTTNGCDVTFSLPITLGTVESPAIVVDVANGSTNTFNACVSGPGAIKYINNGTVNLNVDNDYKGKTTINKGVIHVYADKAFGATNGNTSIVYPTRNPAIMNYVYFHGVTMDENFVNDTKIQQYGIRFPAGTTNTFNGTFIDSQSDHSYYGNNAKVVYNGYVKFPNLCPDLRSAVVEFNGEGSLFEWDYYQHGTIIFGAKCFINDSSHYMKLNASQKRYFKCENAMYYEPTKPAFIYVLGGSALADMCGYDQTFWYVSCSSSYSSTVITSGAPSTVHLTLTNWTTAAASPATSYARFRGAVGLSFEGPLPMSLGTASTATGALSLSNGSDITFLNGFGWGGKSLSVTDGSTLTIAGTTTFPKELAVAIADRPASSGVEAKPSRLALNAKFAADTLELNGVQMMGGRTYGSSSSTAEVKDDVHFAGTGVLRVKHPCGTRVVVR